LRKLVIIVLIAFFATALVVLDACKKKDSSVTPPVITTPIQFVVPNGWPQPPTDIFANNPLTAEGFALGRKLFYDPRLSVDNTVACANCHQQFAAFATYDHDFSHGLNNTHTFRNAPGLFNLAWMQKMHWDGGINHIEVQPLAPLTHPLEMGETIENVVNKLKADTLYPKLFSKAFGGTEVNSQKMLKALSQFMGSMVSYNSKYDKVKRGEANFTLTEQNGYTVFKSKCAGCHPEPLFTDNSFRNNGMPVNPFLNDFGRMRITGSAADSLKFKVPSLRNIGVSVPYMHDGRFNSVGSVIDHYRNDLITTQPTLDPLLKNRISITNQEKNDLIFFLFALTDTSFTKDPRFSMQ
jgi:cytochrome c peroxidase